MILFYIINIEKLIFIGEAVLLDVHLNIIIILEKVRLIMRNRLFFKYKMIS